MNISIIIFIVVFIAVLFLIEGIYLAAYGSSIQVNNRINRRMSLLSKGADNENVLIQLRKEGEQHRNFDSVPLYSMLANYAQRANIAFSPMTLLTIMVVLSVLASLIMLILTDAAIGLVLVLGICAGFGGVFVWVMRKAKQRTSLFEEQLPDAIDLMVRSLKVGHPLGNALNVVANEMSDPIGSEFGLISDESTYGMEISDAFEELAERLDMQDVRFLSVAIGIQQRSGGNLVEILDGLGKVIRGRFRLFRRVRAITSEARWSGVFLSIFPVLALVLVNLTNPNYYSNVYESVFFVPAALIVATMLIANVFVMRALVNIKV